MSAEDHRKFVELLTGAGRAAYGALTESERRSLGRAGRAAYASLRPSERRAFAEFFRALRGLAMQFGADSAEAEAVLHREFGVSFFKRISRAAKKVGKAIVKSPIVKGAAGLVAVVYPPVGVPLTAALAVASKAVDMTKSADKKVKALGQKIIKGTLEQAKINPDAARGAELLRKVAATKALPVEAQLKLAAAKETRLRKMAAKSRGFDKLDKAQKHNGFIVTRQGKIIPGTKLLKIAGEISGCY